jgi:hypothetical protein
LKFENLKIFGINIAEITDIQVLAHGYISLGKGSLKLI